MSVSRSTLCRLAAAAATSLVVVIPAAGMTLRGPTAGPSSTGQYSDGPISASEQSTIAELRVEAAGATLDSGTAYVTDTARLVTDRRAECGGTGQTKTVAGPTALGILGDGSRANRRLRPLAVSDKFSFGLFVCGIGGFFAGADAYWTYRVNHVAPEVGADQKPIRRLNQVLWVYQDTKAGVNTGDELVISAPGRVKAGAPFFVRVAAYNAAGTPSPAAGATVSGPDSTFSTDADGKALVTVHDAGTVVGYRAGRRNDIPSERVGVCVYDTAPEECTSREGELIVGSPRGDTIRGTRGSDEVRAGRGNDRIDVRRGDRDLVRCGPGRDTVRMDNVDTAVRDCERVIRP